MSLYYTPPSDNVFNEVLDASKKIWQSYDNTYGYVDEKINKIKDLQNIRDNFLFIFFMFDHVNQQKLLNSISNDAKFEILSRMTNAANNSSGILSF